MRRVKDHRYLYRRGDQLYFRRKVPSNALAAFGGRMEIQKSLETSSLADARHLLAIEVAKFDRTVATAAGKPLGDALRQIAPAELPTPAELEARVRQWLTERVERAAIAELDAAHRDRDEAKQIWLGLKAHADSVTRGIGVEAEDPSLTTIWLADHICEAENWKIGKVSSLWRHLLRIRRAGKRKSAVRDRGLTDVEAKIILAAALKPPPARLSPERKLARRWVPWLCAYPIGSRINFAIYRGVFSSLKA